MAERNYYVLCDDNCKFPAMSKEQILTAIEQAITTGEIKDVDTGFVTKIKETNANKALSFWIGPQAEYNALTERAENCFYIITDEPDINETLNDFNDKLSALDDSLNKSVKELSDDIEVLNGDVSGRLWHKTLFIPDSITTPSVNDIRHVWDQLPESIAFSATLKNKTYESAVFGYRVGEYGYFIYLTHYSSY